jgi:hypothetical protein
MDEQTIRRIVNEEMAKGASAGRFGLNMTPIHRHTGVGGDGPQIKQDDIVPSVSVSGRITFAQKTDYTINLNSSFTPSRIQVYGIAYDASGGSGVRCIIDGSASLGPSFFLQPTSGTTSVVTGNVQYPTFDKNVGSTVPLQSASYLWVQNGSTTFHGQPGEGHIVNVEWDGTVYARATITVFSKTKVVVHVSDLAAGWEIYTNIVIT